MSKISVDLSALHEEAQREIMDFYEFLKGKYAAEMARDVNFSRLVPREIEPFPMPGRDELHDRKSFL